MKSAIKLKKIKVGEASLQRSAVTASPANRAETDELLLTAVADLMIEKDSVEFSLSEVAAKSKMSAALVQYHFGSKDGLLMALLERKTSKAVEQLRVLADRPVPAERKLRMHVRGLVDAYVQGPYINRLLHYMMNNGDDNRAKYISDIFITPVAEFHRKLIEQGVSEGTFRWIDPMHFYFLLVGACDHLVARRRALHYAFGVTELSEELSLSYSNTLYELIRRGIMIDSGSSVEAA